MQVPVKLIFPCSTGSGMLLFRLCRCRKLPARKAQSVNIPFLSALPWPNHRRARDRSGRKRSPGTTARQERQPSHFHPATVRCQNHPPGRPAPKPAARPISSARQTAFGHADRTLVASGCAHGQSGQSLQRQSQQPGTTYYYRVCAVDTAGQRGPSSLEAAVSTKATAAAAGKTTAQSVYAPEYGPENAVDGDPDPFPAP